MLNLETPLVRSFYRVVQDEVVTVDDFMSYQALGKPLWNPTPERLRRWKGISVFESDALARSKARDYNLGTYIAILVIPEDDPIEIEQTGRRGHFTLYGTPDDFLRYVVSVVPIEERSDERGV